eukprot:TRINITY_DN41338_c0_g1_i1.p1 TRINITY_DN41338_c0_g1~~TRINITY_DN41338_c0_g1_i1.p1  ORF type:complete len:274 (+),score=69.05 TRINITY_DN41338_c0_g1_i1:122-943(+)
MAAGDIEWTPQKATEQRPAAAAKVLEQTNCGAGDVALPWKALSCCLTGASTGKTSAKEAEKDNDDCFPLADDLQAPQNSVASTKPKQPLVAVPRGPQVRKHLEVWLHIYDLDSVTARLNELVLRGANLGAYHCGVEVMGDEWYFAWGQTSSSGVVWSEPKGHTVHIYRESMCMGVTPLSERQVEEVIYEAMKAWPANSYHPIHRNCVSFAEHLVKTLKAPKAFPTWVHGAAEATSKSVALEPIADLGWRALRWWCTTDTSTSQLKPPEAVAVG